MFSPSRRPLWRMLALREVGKGRDAAAILSVIKTGSPPLHFFIPPISKWQQGKQFTVDSRCSWLWNAFCHVRGIKKRPLFPWTTLSHINIVLYTLIIGFCCWSLLTDTEFLAAQSHLYFYVPYQSAWNRLRMEWIVVHRGLERVLGVVLWCSLVMSPL